MQYFITRLFVPQTSQSSPVRRSKFDIWLAIPSTLKRLRNGGLKWQRYVHVVEKKIPFLDVHYDMLNIANKEYVVCHKCCYKINSYVNGNITVDDIISDVTDKDVAAYLMNLKSEKEKGNVRIDHKVMMQQNNPLYDDIHQIAENL